MRNWYHRSSRRQRCLRGTLSAEIQSLELRALPAGTVTASVTGGNITLTGDGKDNQIALEILPGGIFLTGFAAVDGDDPTIIKLAQKSETEGNAVKLSSSTSIIRDLTINLKGGDDWVFVDVGIFEEGAEYFSTSIGRNLSIDMGSGDDAVILEVANGALTINNNLSVVLGAGDDYLFAEPFSIPAAPDGGGDPDKAEDETSQFVVGKDVSVTGSSGDDLIGLIAVGVVRDVRVETGSGADIVGIGTAGIGRNLSVSSGADNDNVELVGSFVGGNVNLLTGSGDDRVAAEGNFVGGNISIRMGTGSDSLAVIADEDSIGEKSKILVDGGDGRKDKDTLAADVDESIESRTTVDGFEIPNDEEEAPDAFDLFELIDEYVFDALFG